MSSPGGLPPVDVSFYKNLRVFDLSDQEIIAAMLAWGQREMPGWNPNEGSTEVVLVEEIALACAELITAINRVPGAVTQTILSMAGVERDPGYAPTAEVLIKFSDTLGHTVPTGTRFYLVTDDGETVTFLAEPPGAEALFGVGQATCSVIGETFTDAANGAPVGTPLATASVLPFIDQVTLSAPVVDGRDPETDSDWLNRGVARLARLSDTLVVPHQFEAAARERPEVARAVGIDLYDPASGTVAGNDPGHMTVAVLGDGSALLSQQSKDAILVDLNAKKVALLVVHVVDVALVAVDVAVAYSPLPGYSTTITSEAVRAALRVYLDPLTWDYGPIVRHNEIVSLVDQVEGVDWVGAVTMANAADSGRGDLVLTGATELPQAGQLTITLTS